MKLLLLLFLVFFFSLYSLPCQRKPLIEELGDNLEAKEKPLIQEFAEDDLSALNLDHNSPPRPVIKEINERFTRLNKPSRCLIEELDIATDCQGRGENSKSLILEMPPDGTSDGAAKIADLRESGLSAGTDSQSSLVTSWETLQKLAEQVGSTIE